VVGRLLLISSGSATLGGVCGRSLPVGEAASAELVIEYGCEINRLDGREWLRPRNGAGKARHVTGRRAVAARAGREEYGGGGETMPLLISGDVPPGVWDSCSPDGVSFVPVV